MGYRGKAVEREEARRLRAEGQTMAQIAQKLGVSKGSVSLWVRDVAFERRPRAPARRRGPNALQRRKAAEIEALGVEGRARIGPLSRRDLLIAGVALYAGEGGKTDGKVQFTNTDPRLVGLFCAWLRTFFEIDEARLRARLYLHQGLDLGAALTSWSAVTGIPVAQFGKPYRAIPDEGLRGARHVNGCATVVYHCSALHRTIMGMLDGLLGASGPGGGARTGTVCRSFRGSSIGRAVDC